jgi:hypothetical protein
MYPQPAIDSKIKIMKNHLESIITASVSIALLVGGLISNAYAGDGSATGKISRIDAVGALAGAPNSGDIRVYIPGGTFCSGPVNDATWGFINVSDSNYKGILANLMMAFSANKTITVNARSAPIGSNTYCQITWINVFQ